MVKEKKSYIPKKGDVVWITFSPTKGHEQKGKRPALVVSSFLYNEKSGLSLMCPITNKKKNYPFEVELKNNKTKGCVLSDQIRSFDYRERDIKFIEKASEEVILSVVQKISLLINN